MGCCSAGQPAAGSAGCPAAGVGSAAGCYWTVDLAKGPTWGAGYRRTVETKLPKDSELHA